MDKILDESLFRPSVEAARRAATSGTLGDSVKEQISPYVQSVRDIEVALLGLSSALGHNTPEPGQDDVFNAFVDRYERNLGVLSNNLQLHDGGDVVSVSWEDLAEHEQDALAEQVLHNQQGVLGIVGKVKVASKLTKTDVERIKVYQHGDELKDMLRNADTRILSVVDITRIYLRNKYPQMVIDSFYQAYEANEARISTFEFRELFVRRGIEGVSETSVETYIQERNRLSEDFKVPTPMIAVIKLRFAANSNDEKRNVTQAAIMIELIRTQLKAQLSPEKADEMINAYFANFANTGVVVPDLTKLELKEFVSYARDLASTIRRAVSLDEHGNLAAAPVSSPINLARVRRDRQREERLRDLSQEDEEVIR